MVHSLLQCELYQETPDTRVTSTPVGCSGLTFRDGLITKEPVHWYDLVFSSPSLESTIRSIYWPSSMYQILMIKWPGVVAPVSLHYIRLQTAEWSVQVQKVSCCCGSNFPASIETMRLTGAHCCPRQPAVFFITSASVSYVNSVQYNKAMLVKEYIGCLQCILWVIYKLTMFFLVCFVLDLSLSLGL